MVGYSKNAPKDEEWLLEEIAKKLHQQRWHKGQPTWENSLLKDLFRNYAHQIIATIEEGGWVSPAYLKDALSGELAAGFRLGLNKSKAIGYVEWDREKVAIKIAKSNAVGMVLIPPDSPDREKNKEETNA